VVWVPKARLAPTITRPWSTLVGYIDCDTHAIESLRTWSYLAPKDEHFRPPEKKTDGSQSQWNRLKHFWEMPSGQLIICGLEVESAPGQPPPSVRLLDDVAGRVKWMDDLNVDTQIIIPSFFLAALFTDPAAQTALTASYNRWMADCSKESNGRLRWSLVPPLLDIDAAKEEIRFGAANDAASVMMRPLECEKLLTDPYFYPVYEEAQKHNLTIGVHIGNASSPVYENSAAIMHAIVPMTAAFVNIFTSDFATRFPELRFGFLEGGSEWLPFALREISRGAETAWRQDVALADVPLAGTNLFIDCTFDEDLPYVLKFSGEDNLVLGSDFGHADIGTDVGAHGVMCERTDVDAAVLNKITSENGRRLYGL